MQTSSAKAKGRALQKYVKNKILDFFSTLEPDDVRSTAMGQSGEDIQLSPAAKMLVQCSFECKSRAKVHVYQWYWQAKDNSGNLEPVLVIKQNNAKPLAVVDLDYFLSLVKLHSSC